MNYDLRNTTSQEETVGKLTTKEREDLSPKDFALPGGRYPLPDINHAKNALARVSQFGSDEEKAKVRQKVKQKFPSIGKPMKTAKSGTTKSLPGK